MKKIVSIGLVAVSLAATSAFGQGYFIYATGKSQAYDGFTTAGVSTLDTKVNTAFLWAAASTATPMPIASTPTTGTNGMSESYIAATAWTDILTGGFTLAQNAGSGNANVTAFTAANGGIAYNGSQSFGVTGTSPDTVYSVFIIGWDGQYATAAAAAAANAAVGWSTVFQYTSKTSIGTGTSMSALGANFGVFAPATVPEPASMALAALGGAALLMIRRRKA